MKRIRWNNLLVVLLAFTSLILWLDGQGLRRDEQQLIMSNNMYQLDNERLKDDLAVSKEYLRGYEIKIANLEDELKVYK